MATIEQLKQLFKTDSDEQAILAASKRYGIAPEDIASEVGYDVGGKWGNRGGASIDSYQANLYGLAEGVTGANWARRGREANEAAADLQMQFARGQGAVDSYKDIRSVGDAADYVGGLAVQSAPYMAEALVGGVAGRGIATGLRAAAPVVRAAGIGGAVAAGYPSAVGDILQNQREQSGQTNTPVALGLGLPYAALNAVGVEGALARGGLTRNAIRALDDARGVRGLAARGTVSAIRTGAEEGAAEVGQEALNQFGRMAVDPNETFLNERSAERFKESAVGGAALGGVFGGVGGWRRGSMGSQPVPPPTVDDRQQTDLLSFGEYKAPPPLTGPEMPPEERAALMAGSFDPGLGEYRAPDGIPFTREVDTNGLSLAVDERPQTFALGTALPGPQAAPADPGLDVRSADPNQQELFYPNGQPTYGADASFSGREPAESLEPPSPEFGLADYTPRQDGIPFTPEFDTGGLSLTPRPDAPQIDLFTGELVAPPPPAPPSRPDFQLESYGPSQQGEFDFQPPAQPGPPEAFAERNAMRSNQRGFVADLPFAPPEAKITTPLGQQLYTTADSLMKEGFLDDGAMTQITTLLTQNKLGAAAKLVNGALADRNQAKKALETVQQEQIQAQQKVRDEQAQAAEQQRAAAIEEGKKIVTEPRTPDGKTADDIFAQVKELETQRLALLQKNGRLPNQGTPKRRQHDALWDQIQGLKQTALGLMDQKAAQKKSAEPKKPAKTDVPAEDQAAQIDKWERLVECLRG